MLVGASERWPFASGQLLEAYWAVLFIHLLWMRHLSGRFERSLRAVCWSTWWAKKRADDARCAFTAWRARGVDAERGGGPPHDRHAASDHYRPIPHPVVMLGYFLLFFGACFLFFVFLIRMRKSAPLLFVRY